MIGNQAMQLNVQDNPDVMTQHAIGELLGTSGRSIGRWYSLAFVGRVPGTSIKLYSLQAVCDQISQQAGKPLQPDHIPDLIDFEEAFNILVAAGVRRSGPTWRRWGREKTGPTQYRVGGSLRYLQPEVQSWAQYLKACPQHHKSKSDQQAESGATVGVHASGGCGGGTLEATNS